MGTGDYFSYETCEGADFKGNGWVGRCKNCGDDYLTSFCTCGGLDTCLCKAGSDKQTVAAGKPAFVGEVESFGHGCMAHDKGKDVCADSTKQPMAKMTTGAWTNGA